MPLCIIQIKLSLLCNWIKQNQRKKGEGSLLCLAFIFFVILSLYILFIRYVKSDLNSAHFRTLTKALSFCYTMNSYHRGPSQVVVTFGLCLFLSPFLGCVLVWLSGCLCMSCCLALFPLSFLAISYNLFLAKAIRRTSCLVCKSIFILLYKIA